MVPYAYINYHWGLTGWTDEEMGWIDWWVMFVLVEIGYYWYVYFSFSPSYLFFNFTRSPVVLSLLYRYALLIN